jgi:hypothetical protein
VTSNSDESAINKTAAFDINSLIMNPPIILSTDR